MNYYQGPQGNMMQDSEALFSDDVYRQLLREDSLLTRTGSNNFASLIDPPEVVAAADPLVQQQYGSVQQQPQQEQQQQQQQHVAVTMAQNVMVVNSPEEFLYSSLAQGQEPSWDEVEAVSEIVVPENHGQIILEPPPEQPVAQVESTSYGANSAPYLHQVPSIQDWPGQYSFDITLDSDNKERNKWCYSQMLKKLYVCPNVAVPVNVKLSEWVDASLTITPVFKESRHRVDPVTRCFNCKNAQVGCNPALAKHVVQVEGEESDYRVLNERCIVTLPLRPPPPGETVSTLLVKLMCLTSCVGGPNRRPFCLVFTLNSNGNEIGRQILDVKCCKCPTRDMNNDDKAAASQRNSLDSESKEKVCKLAKSLATTCQKRKRHTVKLEPGSESRYEMVPVPVEFVSKVKKYVNCLISEQHTRQTQPGLLLFPEEQD